MTDTKPRISLDEMQHVLRSHLTNPTSSFSIGSFGAIAEFHRDPTEALTVDQSNDFTIATARGALRLDLSPETRPVAYENLSRKKDSWQQGVVFCLPEATALSHQRSGLTELGPDRDAIRPADRQAILFDMGLKARNIDFCIRTNDPELLKILRAQAGQDVMDPANTAMAAILDASPNRIALSKLGRLEVFQAIGKTKTPEGPHTHVLPKLLKGGRTHSANTPVPEGYLPGLTLYPSNPVFDSLGNSKTFDPSEQREFTKLLTLWGPADYLEEKERVFEALASGQLPDSYPSPKSRLQRTALRIALRQAAREGEEAQYMRRWTAHFETGVEDAPPA